LNHQVIEFFEKSIITNLLNPNTAQMVCARFRRKRMTDQFSYNGEKTAGNSVPESFIRRAGAALASGDKRELERAREDLVNHNLSEGLHALMKRALSEPKQMGSNWG
jgi:hypothetical protein